MWILTFHSSSNDPLVYTLKPGKNTIGRSTDNDIVIAEESVSRAHAEIDCQDNRLVIRDLGSKNGTFVNQERIEKPHVLKSGDQIHIGQRLTRLFSRNTNPLSLAVDDLSETKPRICELSLEPVDPRAALLYEVANRLTMTQDLEKALAEAADLIRQVMDAEKCAVIQAKNFDQIEALGYPTEIAHQAIENRLPVVIPDPSERTPKARSKLSWLSHIRSAICMPILIEEEVAGIIFMFKTDPASRLYDRGDMQLVTAVGYQAALAIQRARLLEKAEVLEKWAVTDSLTGLYNRRHTLNLAELEYQRAQSLERPLTILMLDIDRFKEVNDTWGHSVGDQVLKEVTGRLKAQLRSIDTFGRYGGDEFVVLLVDTGLEGAKLIAERLRLAVGDTPVNTDQGAIQVSISIGVTALAEDSLNLAALLDQADKAMYAAKTGGKNRVEITT